jgi:hypothetical protein
MNTNQPSNTLAIIGLILGIIAIIFAFIPCIGTLAFIPGVIGLILGVISYMKAKDEGHPKGMPIGVIVVSLVACAISAFQIFTIGTMASGMKSEMKDYTTCDEVKVDYENVKKEMEALTKEMENDNASFSAIRTMTSLGMKLGHIQGEAERLECDIEMEGFEPAKINEKDADEGNKAEGDNETKSVEEEQGN